MKVRRWQINTHFLLWTLPQTKELVLIRPLSQLSWDKSLNLFLFISSGVLLYAFVSTSLVASGRLIGCLYSLLISCWVCIVLHHGTHADTLGSQLELWNSFPLAVWSQNVRTRKLWVSERSLTDWLDDTRVQQQDLKSFRRYFVINLLQILTSLCVVLPALPLMLPSSLGPDMSMDRPPNMFNGTTPGITHFYNRNPLQGVAITGGAEDNISWYYCR